MTIDELLNNYRKQSTSETDKGTSFERLMKIFLPIYYRGDIKNVMRWNEFSNEQDLGIDLVAETHSGEYWAVQCKFYAENTTITKSDVDSFIANSGRTFNGKHFSRRIFISTSSNFNSNANKMFENQTPPIIKIGMDDLRTVDFDWNKLIKGENPILQHNLRDYQQDALNNAVTHFNNNNRGKLIMACGTGKTFTALRIAETLTNNAGLILFLVPSLSLLKQTLREWTNHAIKPINPICVCSDQTVAADDDINTNLPIPVTNLPNEITAAVNNTKPNIGMTVIFSTYQSIDKVIAANLNFDLVICDEAHRTAGNNSSDKETKLFAQVHDNNLIHASRRLYMTATPKLYNESIKNIAKSKDITIWSMDDESIYGKEFYKISFKQAIDKGRLSDYRVLIFAVSEDEIHGNMRDTVYEIINQTAEALKNKHKRGSANISFSIDDATKIIGCINALSKRVTADSEYLLEGDLQPMHKAVLFESNIPRSEFTANIIDKLEEIYKPTVDATERDKLVEITAKHVDGSMNARERSDALNNLENTATNGKDCTIVTNVRCLSEGVDVPSLDAVIFMSPKKSKIDIVQAIGRALRVASNKTFGYIIIPIVAPTTYNGETKNYYKANNERYRTVYQVVQALKAHDESMNAEIERLAANVNSNNKHTGKLAVINNKSSIKPELSFDIFKTDLIGKIVETCGNHNYWYEWAQKVSIIVKRHTDHIHELINTNSAANTAFNNFLRELKNIINPNIKTNDAVDMLAQHLVTRPIFEALFENYSFTQNNPVSKSMTDIIAQLDNKSLSYARDELKNFYDQVRENCKDMGSAENRQRIITNLYDSFFKMALPTTVQKLGIVYTPVEVVDFIINSVNDVLRENFNRTISDKNIHILDPFTGTGTFITRLIQSGLISNADLKRKYQSEIHANEIVLLAYYIAAINIENAFHDTHNLSSYLPFDGICLTDTFQSYENAENPAVYLDNMNNPLRENSAAIKKQLDTKIEIIIGNPPYSVGQKSANDNAQNEKYPHLDKLIADTYAAGTNATNKNSLYDSYIKAFRWASERIKSGGIIGFVTNAGWIDGAAMDGMRKCFEREFTSIYIFNLRGNQRTQGETSRREGGKIFGSGSRAPIAITILVKNPALQRDKAEIHYCDIGDYLSREDKLARIAEYKSVLNMPSSIITPNDKGDWINQRGDTFEDFIIIGDKKDKTANTIFNIYSMGIGTSRDAWTYNYSRAEVSKNMNATIDYYNEHTVKDNDNTKISWSSSLENYSRRRIKFNFEDNKIYESMYRPFCKEYLYFGDGFIHRRGQMNDLFPNGNEDNLLICLTVTGEAKDFSVMMTDKVTDLHFNGDTQCFPMYWYEENRQQTLPGLGQYTGKYIRREGVTDWILAEARRRYGEVVTKADIFYYVYGFLHMPEYRVRFAAELKKSLPRIILVESAEFWALSRAGRQLADLHLNYERMPIERNIFNTARIIGDECGDYRVTKMKFNKERAEIIYNGKIRIVDIPARANEYVVNGRSPLEWIVERYQIKTDKASGIVNNPNDWCVEHGKPRYILDLIMSCIEMSLRTLDIVESLPDIKFE